MIPKIIALMIVQASLAASPLEIRENCDVASTGFSPEQIGVSAGLMEAISTYAATPDFPNSNALTKWQSLPAFISTEIDLASYPRVPLACGDKTLYPSHPQQDRKLYHRYRSNQYNLFKLRGDDEACRIPQKFAIPGKAPACVKGDLAYEVVLSDTFRDRCGNFYRGFKQYAFLGKYENMGTLFSPGRTLAPNPHSEDARDMVADQTFPVNEKEFLFLGPLLPDDKLRAEKHASENNSDFTYDDKTMTYSRRSGR